MRAESHSVSSPNDADRTRNVQARRICRHQRPRWRPLPSRQDPNFHGVRKLPPLTRVGKQPQTGMPTSVTLPTSRSHFRPAAQAIPQMKPIARRSLPGIQEFCWGPTNNGATLVEPNCTAMANAIMDRVTESSDFNPKLFRSLAAPPPKIVLRSLSRRQPKPCRGTTQHDQQRRYAPTHQKHNRRGCNDAVCHCVQTLRHHR